jgi:hypothetical protein
MTNEEKIETLELKVKNLELEVEILKLSKTQIIYPYYQPIQWPDDSRHPQPFRYNDIWC